ncbi:MAG: hypothetical protein P4K94_09305 [Terracidiphilus sp.]|nr:hypothetical protein [Terracidiphilus sp.]
MSAAGIAPATVLVEGGRIAALHEWDAAAARNFDVRDFGDAIPMPGLVESHVHMNELGRTEWERFRTATRTAAAGE